MLLFLNLGLLLGGLEVEVAVGYLETKFPQNFPNFHWGVLWQSMKQVVEVSRAEQLLSDDQRQLLALQRQARWRSCWGLLETYLFWLATVEAFFREFKQKETGVFFGKSICFVTMTWWRFQRFFLFLRWFTNMVQMGSIITWMKLHRQSSWWVSENGWFGRWFISFWGVAST